MASQPGPFPRRRNRMSVGDQVMDIIAEKLDVARDKVKAEANLQTDLGADSLDIVELLMHLEDNFGIKIPDEDAENLKTVGDAIAYIEASTPVKE
jgi:acyl carrier protein